MYAALKVITPPVQAALSLAFITQHLRLDSDDDQDLIEGHVQVATEMAESYLNRALITQTLQYTVSDHVFIPDMYLVVLPLALTQIYATPHQYVELPRAPLQSITSVIFNNADGTTTPTTDFTTNLQAEPASVTVRYSGTLGISASNFQITYVAGYGPSPASIPITIRHGIAMITAWLYEARGDKLTTDDLPMAAIRLLSNYRLMSFA